MQQVYVCLLFFVLVYMHKEFEILLLLYKKQHGEIDY